MIEIVGTSSTQAVAASDLQVGDVLVESAGLPGVPEGRGVLDDAVHQLVGDDVDA